MVSSVNVSVYEVMIVIQSFSDGEWNTLFLPDKIKKSWVSCSSA